MEKTNPTAASNAAVPIQTLINCNFDTDTMASIYRGAYTCMVLENAAVWSSPGWELPLKAHAKLEEERLKNRNT